MARIRTIKPEFWDSPGTARASLRARLFFIALWNWADDYGVGTANPKQLVGFAFPNDDDMTVAEFPRLRTEVSECYGVVWYTVSGRPFYAIPSWDDHQKNERRAKGKNPTPDQADSTSTELPRVSTDVQALEQGNRGTGEQGNRGTGGPTPSAPSIYCNRHPEGFDGPCRGCKVAWEEYERWANSSDEPAIEHVHRWMQDGTCINCEATREEMP